MNSEQILISRFDDEFEKGLANVKFFVRTARVSLETLISEVNHFEDTAASTSDREIISSIDRGYAKTRYDSPFN